MLDDMRDIGSFVGAVAAVAAIAYLALSLWRGRISTPRSTVTMWAKSLLNAVLFFGIFMAALPWGAHQLLPQMLPIPSQAGTWGGTALFAIGVGAWILGLDAFSRRGRGTPSPLDAPSRLVTDGLFGVVRNPIIVSELLVIWGEALYLGSLGIALYAVAVTAGAHLVVIYVEEPELRRRFGGSYEAYCRSVPRWFPNLSFAARRPTSGCS